MQCLNFEILCVFFEWIYSFGSYKMISDSRMMKKAPGEVYLEEQH